MKVFLNWLFVEVIKKFSFFFFPKKSKETKSSQTQRELICAVTKTPWSHSGRITCRAFGFRVYLLHHIFTTGAKYNGIDVLYYNLDQSSTVSTAHSGSQAQRQIWHMQCQQHDVVSLWCIRKRLYSTPCVPPHVRSPRAPAALLQVCVSQEDSMEHVPGHNREIQEWEKVIKGRRRQEVSVSAAFVCETSSFIFIWFSLVTKAPSALLATHTEQQGIVYAWKTGAVWSINTEVTRFKSSRRQAGSMPYQVRANVCPKVLSLTAAGARSFTEKS